MLFPIYDILILTHNSNTLHFPISNLSSIVYGYVNESYNTLLISYSQVNREI